jgi:REP element-mobilizing transposase RayT
MTFNSFHQEGHLYFITASVCGLKKIFDNQEYAQIILDSLSWLQQEQRMRLYVFVLMPSHLHAIVKPVNLEISSLLQQFGSYSAHAILKSIERQSDLDLLEFFHTQRRDKQRKHSVWQDIQAKNIYSEDYLEQKLEYIHSNPVRCDPPLVKERERYRYSSACFFDCGKVPVIPVDDIRELFG